MEADKNLIFLKALFKLREIAQNPKKVAQNKHFGSRYANIEEVLSVAKIAAHEAGFVIVEECESEIVPADSNVIKYSTRAILIHVETGESIFSERSFLSSQLVGNNMFQQIGIATTYFRRYNLMELFNLASEDDDGNGLTRKSKLLEVLEAKFNNKIAKEGEEWKEKFYKDHGIKDGSKIPNMTESQLSEMINWEGF